MSREYIVQKFLDNPVYLSNGSGFLANRWGHSKEDVAKAIKKAMEAIEEYKPELDGVLPKDEYVPLTRTDKTIHFL